MHRASRLRGGRVYNMLRYPRPAGKQLALLITAIAVVLLLLGHADVVGDEPPLELAPLVLPNAWIRVEMAPYFRSGTPTLTGECEVTGDGATAPFFINFKKNRVIVLEEPGTMEGKFEKVCKTVDQTVPSVKITCTIKTTYIVKAKVVGGKMKTHNKAKRLEVISLKIQDYTEKTVTDCILCSPEGCTKIPTQSKHENKESDWWPMELYRWPVVDGHSETVGRFTYTLVLPEP